jgi:hypothetical protein
MLNSMASPPCLDGVQPQAPGMFVVDEKSAGAVRRAWDESGELSAVVELRRHYPLITDNAQARLCVRTIVGWTQRPASDQERG